jgi:hypothetical protein
LVLTTVSVIKVLHWATGSWEIFLSRNNTLRADQPSPIQGRLHCEGGYWTRREADFRATGIGVGAGVSRQGPRAVVKKRRVVRGIPTNPKSQPERMQERW